jgi:hypothetical protein
MRTATIEKFWNSQDDRLAKKTPRCVVTLTERNKVKTWELDLENPAHCEIERWLGFANNYTCPFADGDEPFADGRPFKITYTTTRKSSIDLLVNVGEPVSIRSVPAKGGVGLTLNSLRLEVLRSLSEKPMKPTELCCDIWLRLEQAFDPNPYKAGDQIRVKAMLNRLVKDGGGVKLRRGVYALSDDSRYELFRDSMMRLCTNEPDDTASVTASVGAAPSGWL